RSSSRPAAISIDASRRVDSVSSTGSQGIVIACRSTTQKIAWLSRASSEPAGGWVSTQRRTAPRKLPRCISPVGLMPENTRAMGRHDTGGPTGNPMFAQVTVVYHIPVIRGRYPGMVPYEVTTPVFEGPFDLLLHLILKEEVDLWEISLARI